jgi:hypothetical protein
MGAASRGKPEIGFAAAFAAGICSPPPVARKKSGLASVALQETCKVVAIKRGRRRLPGHGSIFLDFLAAISSVPLLPGDFAVLLRRSMRQGEYGVYIRLDEYYGWPAEGNAARWRQ